MQNKDLISVIIPCYNTEKWILETLQSVFIQKGKFDLEVIVVNDGSTDKSVDIISQSFPEVKLINTDNNGPSLARNLGINESNGNFIQFLDADDLLLPGALNNKYELIKNSDADIIYGNWQKLEQINNEDYNTTEVIERKLENPIIDLFTDFWCPLAVYLLKREIVEKTGGFKESLLVIQDARFILDCALVESQFEYLDEILALYRVHKGGSVSTNNSILFVRDCFENACQIEELWKMKGYLSEEEKGALIKVLGYVTTTSYLNEDLETFDSAFNKLTIYSPDYTPEQSEISGKFRLASKLFGFKNALYLSKKYSNFKKLLK